LLDVLVRRDTRRNRNRAAAADELVVDLARGLERVAHVLAELLVRQRPLDVRARAARPLQQPVCRLRHSPVVLSLGVSPVRARGQSLQTGRSYADLAARFPSPTATGAGRFADPPSSATANTSSIESTGMNSSSRLVSAGSSSRSGSFSRGITMRFSPAR